MGIAHNQIMQKTEEIVRSYLQNGHYPSFSTIRTDLSKWLRDFELGAPRFKHLPVRRKSTMNFEHFNESLEAIEMDIRDAYEVSLQQHNALTKNFSQGEVERARVQHELNLINNEINEMLLSTRNQNTYTNHQALHFFDLAHVDIAKSDALIHVGTGEVSLKELDRFTRKIPLMDAMPTLSVSQHYRSSVTISPYRQAFDDYLNTAWLERIFTDRLSEKQAMEVNLTIPVAQEVNVLSITPHHTKEIYISLSYTEDDSSWINLQQFTRIKITDTTEFSFDNIKPRKLRITFIKYGYDEEDQNGFYYYFGAKDISLYKKMYEQTSTLVTAPIAIGEEVNKVHVQAEGKTPNNTKVTYYVGIHGPEEEVTWKQVNESKAYGDANEAPIQIEMTQREYESSKKIVDSGEFLNGMRVYKLLKTGGISLFGKDFLGGIKDAKLYRGIGRWKREAGYKVFDGSVPLMSDWLAFEKEKGETIQTDFLLRGNQLAFESPERNFYAYTICLWSDTQESRPMTVNLHQMNAEESRNKTGTYSVYCNKERLIPMNDEVNIRLSEGWNEIQLFVHVGDILNRRDLPEHLFPYSMSIGKLDILSFRTQRAELLPLLETTKENLFYNVPANSSRYFAMENNEIFINYHMEDVEFQLVFEGYKDKGERYISIKAVLERDEAFSHITPIIQKIYLKTI